MMGTLILMMAVIIALMRLIGIVLILKVLCLLVMASVEISDYMELKPVRMVTQILLMDVTQTVNMSLVGPKHFLYHLILMILTPILPLFQYAGMGYEFKVKIVMLEHYQDVLIIVKTHSLVMNVQVVDH